MIESITSRIRVLGRRPILLAVSAAGLLLAVLCIIYASQYFPARAKLDAAIADARAKGEPIWFSDLDPGPERNPSEDAKLLLALCQQIVLWDDDEDELEERFKNRVFSDPFDRTIALTPAEHDRIKEVANANTEVLQAITEIAGRGDCWFAYDYETVAPWLLETAHLNATRRAQFAAAVDTFVAMRSNDESQFLVSVQRHLNFAEVLRNEQWLVSQGMRMRWINDGVTFIEEWAGVASLKKEDAGKLELRLIRLERALRLAPTVLNYRTAVLTTMANLDDRGTQDLILIMYPPVFSVDSEFRLGDLLSIDPQRRQVMQWSSLRHRSWLMNQQVFVIEAMRRQACWIDEPGPSAAHEMSAIDGEIMARSVEEPVCKAVLLELAGSRNTALSLRQRLINASVLLRLSRTYGDDTDPSDGLIENIAAAIKAAPAGYFSGNPLQHEIEQSTVTLFDVNPENGERVGEFTLRLFDAVSANSETDAAENSDSP